MDILATIAERTITEAMARGELDDLAGAGQPLAMGRKSTWNPVEFRVHLI